MLALDEFVPLLLDIGVDILAGVEIIEVTAATIAVEFVRPQSSGVTILSGVVVGVLMEELTGVLAFGIIGVVTRIGIEVLGGVNVTLWTAVVTACEFDVPVPLEDSVLLCRTPCIC